jgi:hypothetical protein
MCECECLTPEEKEQDEIFNTFSYFSKLRRMSDDQLREYLRYLKASIRWLSRE